MATRSEVLNRAIARIPQSNVDPLYTYAQWGDFYQAALAIFFAELVGLNMGFYLASADLVVDSSTGEASLPDRMHQARWVSDPDGDALWPVRTDEQEYVERRKGFRLEGSKLRLVNWDEDYPATVTLRYIQSPEELGDWDGTDDEAGDGPDYPLDGGEGLRILAGAVAVLAQVKAKTLDAGAADALRSEIRAFAERLGGREKMGPRFIGA